jgi:hypothetical protein
LERRLFRFARATASLALMMLSMPEMRPLENTRRHMSGQS